MRDLTPARSVLAAEDISRRYGQTLALAGVHLTLRGGEVHGIAGHNGAGKSTLLRILSGAERPDHGRILLDGRLLALENPARALSAGIACVYQELSLADNLTVAQNIFLGAEEHTAGRVHDKAMNTQTARLLEQFRVQVRPTHMVGRLPVAQRQMVEILRALHRRARFLLLDEPTTALQPHQIDLLLASLRRIAASQQVAIAIIDHKLEELYAVADRITVLADGQIAFADTTANAPRKRVVDAVVGAGDRRARDVAASPTRPAAEALPPDRSTAPGEPVLKLQAVRTNRLRLVDLDVQPGRVLGIYGLVGSGRTRLLRTVMGLEKITGGTVMLWGQPFRPRSPGQAMKAGIAYLSEERKADGFIPGTDALDNAALPVLSRFSYFGMIRKRAAREAAREALSDVKIRGNTSGPIERLSGGNQQKALLGKVLLQRPRLLLLDEPTKGIDIGSKAEIHSIIVRLAHEQGVAIIVVSSEEEEILAVSDDVALMLNGCLDKPPAPVDAYSVLELRRRVLGEAGTHVTAAT
jgi:ABC-type sugar transport system ATPase subunit